MQYLGSFNLKLINKITATSRNRLLALILIFSIAITLISWMILPGGFSEIEATDYNDFYKPVALNILAGENITLNNSWAIKSPPGFSLIIAIFGWISQQLSLSFETLMALMVLVFSTGSALLLFFIGEKIWGKFGGLLTSFVWISYPITIYLIKQPNSEIPFIFFLLASIYMIVSSKDSHYPFIGLFFSGIFIGFAMLVRPIAIGLGLVLAFLYWLTSKPKTRSVLMGAAILIVGNLLIVFPWEYATYQKTGTIIPLSSNTTGIKSMLDGWTFPVLLKGYREQFNGLDDVKSLAAYISVQAPNIKTAPEFLHLMMSSFQKEPVTFLKFVLIKLIRPWYGTDSGRLDRYILLIQIPYIVCILSSAYLIIKYNLTQSSYFIFFLIISLYLWFTAFLTLPILRYLLPAFPLLFVCFPILVLRPQKNLTKNA